MGLATQIKNAINALPAASKLDFDDMWDAIGGVLDIYGGMYEETVTDANKTIIATRSSQAYYFDTGAVNRTCWFLDPLDYDEITTTIKKVDADAGIVTVDFATAGGSTCDGFASIKLYSQNDFITVRSYNGVWYIVSKEIKIISAVYTHQVADNTSGGSTAADAWTDLPLTNEILDEIGISLAANVLTIPVGTYDIDASHVLVNYNRGMIRLYNVTTSAEITNAFSISECQEAGRVDGNSLQIKIRVTFAVETQIKMQYYVTNAYGTHGLGAPMNLTPDHVANFGRIILNRVA